MLPAQPAPVSFSALHGAQTSAQPDNETFATGLIERRAHRERAAQSTETKSPATKPRTLSTLPDLALHEAFRDLDAGHFTTAARDVYRLLVEDDLSPRGKLLLAAMAAWDEAGAGESPSAHDKTLCRIGAELLDQIIADRMADPKLEADLMASVGFTCECPLNADEVRKLYRVTGHNGSVTTCAYCPDCASLAGMDWNGETAAIGLIGDAS